MTSSAVKTCQNCKSEFRIEPEDFAFYEKMQVPPPTWCSQCRLQRRLAFSNDRALYKRTCDLCGNVVIASHPPDRDVTVYCNPCWWSDKWDGTQHARDYDPSRPFLEQLKELIRETPQMARDANYPTLVNSDYVNHSATAKNCYLTFTADECENVLYAEILIHNKDSMDSTMLAKSELCYGLVNANQCYRVFFSEDCDSCQEVYFSKDCVGCSYCFGCIGLRNKSYYIFNQPYTKETYQKKIKEFRLDSHSYIERLKQKVIAFWQKYPHKFSHVFYNLNVTGDYIFFSKNAKDMYIVYRGVEDCRYCQIITMPPMKDSYDYTLWGHGAQRIYECMIAGEGADTIKFSFQVWPNVREIEYSFFTLSSSYMFGCANIRNKKYCILNKEYPKTEWERLREKIIRDMNGRPYRDKRGRVHRYGEFFPSELSLSGYNESYAMDYFPLTKEEAEGQGFSWYEASPNPHEPTISPQDIPDSINEVTDAIAQEIIACSGCKKPFRIVPQELTLLRTFGLPIPRKCPNCRYQERRDRINPPSLYHRTCQCQGTQSKNNMYANTATHVHGEALCPNEFETSYAPEKKEIIYCEKCYQAEVA